MPSYDNWLDEPYNQPDPICCECGEDIDGDVIENRDDEGRLYFYCKECKGMEEDKQ